jgi:hypothetical protein
MVQDKGTILVFYDDNYERSCSVMTGIGDGGISNKRV